ncbi:MAG TPA: DUF222 domain-containing protein, partial [Streptosporangiaceae bacterium]
MTVAADGFASTGEALGVVQSAMGYLAGADYAGMPGEVQAEVQAEVLRVMERVDAVQATVRGRAVSAFAAALTYHEYAVRGMPRWFVTQTRVTKAAGSAHKAWARRADEHPGVIDAMIEGVLSESWARAVCAWTGRLPEDCVQDADAILVQAARRGADLEGLARIAAEIAARIAPPDEDEGKLADRSLRLHLTFEGAGVLAGELSPECAVVVKTVLDALAGSVDKEDLRSHQERYHDALHEAMKRLLADGGLPGKGGKPLTRTPAPDSRLAHRSGLRQGTGYPVLRAYRLVSLTVLGCTRHGGGADPTAMLAKLGPVLTFGVVALGVTDVQRA